MKKLFLSFAFGLISAAAVAAIPSHTQYAKYQFASAPYAVKMAEIELTMDTPAATGWGTYLMFAGRTAAGQSIYMGVQQDDRDGKKVLFSMWDASSTNKVRPYSLPQCRRFDHEGNGGQCILKFQWKQGVKYKLVMGEIPAQTTDSGFQRMGGWIVDMSTGTETFIGGYEVPHYNNMFGYGGLNAQSMLSNLEYYVAPSGKGDCSSFPATKATWSNVRLDGTYKSSAAYTDYATGINDCRNTNNVAITSRGYDSVTMSTNLGTAGRLADDVAIWSNTQTTPVTPTQPTTPVVVTPPVVTTPGVVVPVPTQQQADQIICTFRAVYDYYKTLFKGAAPTYSYGGYTVQAEIGGMQLLLKPEVKRMEYDARVGNFVVTWYDGSKADLGSIQFWVGAAGC